MKKYKYKTYKMKKYMYIEFLEAYTRRFWTMVIFGTWDRVWSFYAYVPLYSLNVSTTSLSYIYGVLKYELKILLNSHESGSLQSEFLETGNLSWNLFQNTYWDNLYMGWISTEAFVWRCKNTSACLS